MAAPAEERVTFEGPAGPLEGALALPEGAPRAVAVLCHPHPLYDGTMHNKVVHTLARTFTAAGIAALRFNFRGVGDSAGAYDEGDGETEDALAAVAFAHDRTGDVPLWLAGFSFGASVALRDARGVCGPYHGRTAGREVRAVRGEPTGLPVARGAGRCRRDRTAG